MDVSFRFGRGHLVPDNGSGNREVQSRVERNHPDAGKATRYCSSIQEFGFLKEVLDLLRKLAYLDLS